MTEAETPSVRSVLSSALVSALKQRDRPAVALYRATLGAIDNASAVPSDGAGAGAIESSALGVGNADVARRALTEPDMIAIVVTEADERRAAAESVAATRPAAAEQLRLEADLLAALLDGLGAG